MSDRIHSTRRDFIRQTAVAAAAVSLTAGATYASPNDRITLGLIGCGGIMGHHVRGLVENKVPVTVAWLCDVDPAEMERVAARLNGFQETAPRRTSRFEEVLDDPKVDAVIVATPHHWHAPITLRALQAEKDIYIEKPLSHVFAEGPLVVAAAARHKRVVQHGSQMRSSPVTELAGKLLKEGLIGDVRVSKAWNVQLRGTHTIKPDAAAPSGVDYDRWLGPAPQRPFNENRFHGNWRVYRSYGNGDIGDDGIHDIDLARWGLGVTEHPVRITAHGGDTFYRGDHKGDREYPDNMNVSFEYSDGRVLIYEDRQFAPYGLHGFDSGNAFYGTRGYMIFSRRGYFQVYLGPKETKGPTVPKEIRGNNGRGYAQHMQNFLDCVRSRNLNTNAPPQVAHLSCALVHLGEIAYRTKQVLEFDPQKEVFLNDHAGASELLTKSYRAPYTLPSV